MKYVRNLLSITASGDHCVLATRADDSSGQVVPVKFSVADNLSLVFYTANESVLLNGLIFDKKKKRKHCSSVPVPGQAF